MKKLIAVASVVLLLCGCRSIQVTLPGGGTLKANSFACKLSVGSAGVNTNGSAYMTNYNLDQVAGVQAVAEGVVKGMVAGATKP